MSITAGMRRQPIYMSDEDKRAKWTGWLKRGDEAGTVVGELKDSWGWPIEITGRLDKDAGGYVLEGRTGTIPESMAVPIVDDPITKDG